MPAKQQLLEQLRDSIKTIESGKNSKKEGSSSNPPFVKSTGSLIEEDQVPIFDTASLADGPYCQTTDADKAVEKQKASAFMRLERWCSSRFRSESYLRKRLFREGYGAEEIDQAIVRAKRCLLIDDARFADVLIRSRVQAGKGLQGIERELKQEGIDPELIEGWPYDYVDDDQESQKEKALSLLRRKPPRSKNIYASAYRKLIQNGYSPSVSAAASRTYLEESK